MAICKAAHTSAAGISGAIRPADVAEHMAQALPMQHLLVVYEQLLSQITQGAAA